MSQREEADGGRSVRYGYAMDGSWVILSDPGEWVDLGALPVVYTGYQKVIDPAVREKFEKAWKTDLSDQAGLTVMEMMNGAEDGSVKGLYIIGENPMVSDPDLNHTEECLKKFEFLVVQDIFLTETAKLADVVLPSLCFAEKNGTFTNTERKVLVVTGL